MKISNMGVKKDRYSGQIRHTRDKCGLPTGDALSHLYSVCL